MNQNKQCYYFAYGSNMSIARIQHRIPRATRISSASLAGYELKFHKAGDDGSGKCDAYQHQEATKLIGVLYALRESDINSLDRIEGIGVGYNKRTVTVNLTKTQSVEAYMYVATKIDNTILPYDWYVRHVLCGAHENNLPQWYIEQKILSIDTKPDPDKQRMHRELAIYKE